MSPALAGGFPTTGLQGRSTLFPLELSPRWPLIITGCLQLSSYHTVVVLKNGQKLTCLYSAPTPTPHVEQNKTTWC